VLQFLVLANPRSRTKWLSEYLCCGHDLALGCRGVEEFADRLRNVVGSVETGIALGWKLWRELFPDVRFAIVHRVPFEVAESFVRLGFAPDWMFLYQQDRALWKCAKRDPNTVLFAFEGLAKFVVRGELCSWLGVPWDSDRDEKFATEKIEVDVHERLSLVKFHRDTIVAFNNDMAKRLAMLSYGPQ
jgi:hypothetical protein